MHYRFQSRYSVNTKGHLWLNPNCVKMKFTHCNVSPRYSVMVIHLFIHSLISQMCKEHFELGDKPIKFKGYDHSSRG